MIRKIFALATILVVSAANAHFPIAKRLRHIDTNHDRALSLVEALTARQARFVMLDLDRDQALTLAEISSKVSSHANNDKRTDAKQSALARIDERFSRLDKNKDGRISQFEWDGKVTDLFARFDVNNDHLITRSEIRSVRQLKQAQR